MSANPSSKVRTNEGRSSPSSRRSSAASRPTTSTSARRSICAANPALGNVQLVRRPTTDPVIDQQRRAAGRPAGADQAEHLLDLRTHTPFLLWGWRGYAAEGTEFVWLAPHRRPRGPHRSLLQAERPGPPRPQTFAWLGEHVREALAARCASTLPDGASRPVTPSISISSTKPTDIAAAAVPHRPASMSRPPASLGVAAQDECVRGRQQVRGPIYRHRRRGSGPGTRAGCPPSRRGLPGRRCPRRPDGRRAGRTPPSRPDRALLGVKRAQVDHERHIVGRPESRRGPAAVHRRHRVEASGGPEVGMTRDPGRRHPEELVVNASRPSARHRHDGSAPERGTAAAQLGPRSSAKRAGHRC